MCKKEKMNFEHPFTCIIGGPTKSGKTTWVKRFVQNADVLLDPPPAEILWCYSEYQPGYKELEGVPNLVLIEGLPDFEALRNDRERPKLLIFDDLMACLGNEKNKNLVEIFVNGSHHWNCSLIHIVQNLFFNGLRTARINAHYLVLLRNPCDQLNISTLARQLYPRQQNYMLEAYRDACSSPFGYLLVDNSPACEEGLRLRTSIFPDELTICYQPKI